MNQMKTILVTGGNRGIGLEVCRQLDALGYRVILGSRDYLKGKAAGRSLSENVVVHQLDVTNEESIQRLFTHMEKEYGKLDVLINNAGVGEVPPETGKSLLSGARSFAEKNMAGARKVFQAVVPLLRKTGILSHKLGAKDVPLEHVRYIMETNLYGPWRMIQVFVPLLKKSPQGRIINVSSGNGVLKNLTGEYPGYSLSKAALNALTVMLSHELKRDKTSVNAMCPGWVKTDMGGPDAPLTVAEGAEGVVWLATREEIPTGKFFQNREETGW